MDSDKTRTDLDELRRLFGERLGLRGDSLAAQVRRAGRSLPRHIRRDADYLTQVEAMSRNPRLARRVDPRRSAGAQRSVALWLRQIDPRERARTRLINIAALVAFNLLAVFGLVVFVLVRRGLI